MIFTTSCQFRTFVQHVIANAWNAWGQVLSLSNYIEFVHKDKVSLFEFPLLKLHRSFLWKLDILLTNFIYMYS